jgi:carnitine-CoA ligase
VGLEPERPSDAVHAGRGDADPAGQLALGPVRGALGDLLQVRTTTSSTWAPAATAGSFDEAGWFRTGDLVTLHADGYLSFADRDKDMLKVGAENVAASEIERVILATGLVAEVAVVGRPDDKLDEVPVAFVVPFADRESLAADLEAACAQRLADFKVPRAVYGVRDLPRSTLNKVNKAELRKVAAASADRAAAEAQWLAAAASDPSGDAH